MFLVPRYLNIDFLNLVWVFRLKTKTSFSGNQEQNFRQSKLCIYFFIIIIFLDASLTGGGDETALSHWSEQNFVYVYIYNRQ